jgi:hypothetical protein
VSEYQCRRERDVPARQEQRTRTVERTEERARYIYFNYAQDIIDERRSAAEIAQLQADLAEGYRVSNITAFTSPEGPMAPGRRFRGNERLAQDRARAAMERIRRLCASGESCFTGGESGVTPTGSGELYTIVRPTDEGEQEVEGQELATHAVGEFLTQPAEERHRTPELTEELARRRTPQGRAALVYPLLRRAVITLTRTVSAEEQYTETIPAHTESESVTCPDEVKRAAISSFTALSF